MSRRSAERTFYIIQPHFAAPNEWWLLPCSWPQQCSNACDENSHLHLTLHGTASPKASLSVLGIQGAPGSIPFCPQHAHSASHRSPTLGLGWCPPGYKPDALDYTLSKMHKMSSCIILMTLPLSCMRHCMASCLGECVGQRSLDGPEPWTSSRKDLF